MQKYDITLLLIKKIFDGNLYSYKEIYKIAGIDNLYDINYHINILKNIGINVIKIFGSKIKLLQPIYLLDKKKICKYLKNVKIFFVPIIDSTNEFLKKRINFLNLGDICISEHQTKGRGRNGKRWYSPFGCNLYFSMYWYLKNFQNKSIIGLSLAIAVSIAESLKYLGVKKIKIKWPNDIYLYNKKIAGILIDIIQSNINLKKIIIGIGINFDMNNDNNILNNNFISLKEAKINIDRNFLFILLIKNLKIALLKFEIEGLKPFIKKFLEFNMYLNEPINLISHYNDKKICGIYRGINLKGDLLLQQNNIITSWNDSNISLLNL